MWSERKPESYRLPPSLIQAKMYNAEPLCNIIAQRIRYMRLIHRTPYSVLCSMLNKPYANYVGTMLRILRTGRPDKSFIQKIGAGHFLLLTWLEVN